MKALALRQPLHRPLCAVALVVGSVLPNGSTAQIVAGADVTYANRYVWRGVTRASVPVFQPDIYLAYRHANSFVTVGGWWSFETRSGEGEISDSGSGVGGLGESNYWVETSTRVGPLDLAVGVTSYLFDDDVSGGRDSSWNTSELYARLWLETTALIPKVSLWYDIDAIRGAYLETSVDLRVPVLPVAYMYVGALAGWSAGQAVRETAPSRTAYFETDGLTHVDISAWASFRVGRGLSVAPELHAQINEDAVTKRTLAVDSAAVKVWFRIALSWAHQFGGRR
ncbi:MAG: hypothetical protein PVJ64_15795 [Gemmatimonadales bacterium]|jgi:hypothetical protein